MGPQGSGKGTTGSMLARHFDIPLISVGETLRAIPKGYPHYETINSAMEAGDLVPSKIMHEILKARLSSKDCASGFILDGWARRIEDLQAYDPQPDAVLVLEISRETSFLRITGRRICTSNGKTYNIYTLPKERLKECSGELIQRDDDTEEAVKKRLEIYYTQTQEVLDFFEEKGILKHVDAEGSPEAVFENALAALDNSKGAAKND